jgi:hypothetical protein
MAWGRLRRNKDSKGTPMRDPHVVALRYRLETGPQLSFNDPPPVERELDSFTIRLDNGHVHVEMKDHFATVVAARLEVEPFLRSWEIKAALRYGPDAITFGFDGPHVIDRDPPPPSASVIEPTEAAAIIAKLAIVQFTSTQYPDPPDAFVASPDVVAMWDRYEYVLAGRGDLLTSVARWCLTTIEQGSGGRPRAAGRYCISDNVLETLARLAHGGDEKTARKRFPGQILCPHTPAEIAWMKCAIPRIIQRVGEWTAHPDRNWPQITMGDFPKV